MATQSPPLVTTLLPGTGTLSIAKQEAFEEMERAAVRLAELVEYVSAGIVE